ncbi:type IV secretory system conjugative DNA transfer family protein [Citreimonas salinaria]|uniref:Type IV secretory system Conjugative DNA transfer n=1 Tax=Citreimonas salinaria TaxID=321339 RepID=A0A1H3NIR4_9RHOB|nr:type IV secretory system conjugative DNA transfer family protein [Citreimonas salinaria]SDY88325.1 Type IV secretory system Conjugative DNA transfer [Citreimonas salinaria]
MNLINGILRKALSLFTFWLWIPVAVGLIYVLPHQQLLPLSPLERQELLVLLSPLVTWFLIAILDMLEVLEIDAKAGRTNLPIAWILIGVALAPPDVVNLVTPGSVAVPIAAGIAALVTAGMILRSRLRPGALREVIDREVNLLRFGTTWRPAKTKDHGSASLGDVTAAAAHYADGDIIFGVATPHLPEAESVTGKVVRGVARRLHAAMAFTKALVTGLGWKTAVTASRAATGTAKNPPILRGSFGGHMLVVSGSGGGKTVSFVIPNALTYKAGSLVCIDPKSEVHAVTAAARGQLGHDVFKLKPGDFDTDSMNVIGWIDPASTTFTRDCMTVASWIFSDSGGGDDGAAFFAETAKRLFAFVLAFKIAEHGLKGGGAAPNIRDVYDFLFRSPNEISAEITKLYESMKKPENEQRYGAATPQIKTWAGSFVGGDMERTWPNIIASVQKNFWWIGDPSISSVVSGVPRDGSNGQSFPSAAVNNGKTSIFICIPLATLESTPGLARLIVGALLNAIFAAEGKVNGSTLFMVDEMQVLGDFPILHQTALNQGRGYGITLAGIIQAPEALDKQAGDKTFDSWSDNSMLQMFFAIGGEETAERISKTIGETTIENVNYSGQKSKQRGQILGADSGGVSISAERHARRLKTATEIMDLDRTRAIVFRRVGVDDKKVGKKPMIVGTCFYKARPELMAVASDNPFEKKAFVEDYNADPLPQALEGALQGLGGVNGVVADEREDLGDWKEVSPRELVAEQAAKDPAHARLLTVLDALEAGHQVTAEDEGVLARLMTGPSMTRFDAGASEMDDIDLGAFEMSAEDLTKLEQLEVGLKETEEDLERQSEALIAVKTGREMVGESEEHPAVHSLQEAALASLKEEEAGDEEEDDEGDDDGPSDEDLEASLAEEHELKDEVDFS